VFGLGKPFQLSLIFEGGPTDFGWTSFGACSTWVGFGLTFKY
jgi:hypothetical protein